MAERVSEEVLHAARALRRTSTDDERAALERATAEINRLSAQLARTFVDLGFWLKRVREECLYRAHGHTNFEAYLKKEVKVSRGYAYDFIRVVELLPPSMAIALRVEKARAYSAYVEATPKEESLAEVVRGEIRLVRDKNELVLSVYDANVDEVREATRQTKGRVRKGRRAKLSKELRGFMKRAEPRLRKLGVNVSTDGASVQFGHVTPAQLRAFAEQLAILVKVL